MYINLPYQGPLQLPSLLQHKVPLFQSIPLHIYARDQTIVKAFDFCLNTVSISQIMGVCQDGGTCSMHKSGLDVGTTYMSSYSNIVLHTVVLWYVSCCTHLVHQARLGHWRGTSSLFLSTTDRPPLSSA